MEGEHNNVSGALQFGPSVIERAAAFDRRFVKNRQPSSGSSSSREPVNNRAPLCGATGKPQETATVQRSKSRRASVGDEPSVVVSRRKVVGQNHARGTESIGVELENCPSSIENPQVPWIVAHCCSIIEARGLDVLGIYRVPGNSAAVQQLTASVNHHVSTKGTSGIPTSVKLDDPRWGDVNVVSSLLKSFFRLLPEPLLTATLYEHFITVDKIPDCRHRLAALRALVHKLPPSHLATLRFFCAHLQRVVSRAEINKMDSRNLSIVLGPTLVRAGSGAGAPQNSMLSMISDMRHQCHLTETFVNYADYLFTEDSMSTLTLSTLVDLDTRLSSSSSNDSLALMGASTGLCSPLPLVSKFCLLPGTTAPTLSVKEKIQSFECGKAPVLEESALDRKMPVSSLTSSYSLCTSTATNVSAVENPGLSSTVATLKKIASEETAEMQQKRQAQKHVLRLRATVSHDEDLSEAVEGPSLNKAERCGDPMSLSYNERRVLVAEKAKVFEEETRALLEKKNFRGQGTVAGLSGGVNEHRMNREQTEKRWQEVKRQATLLTRDNSDEHIDKENQSSQNMADSAAGVCHVMASSPRSSVADTVCSAAVGTTGTGILVLESGRCKSAGEAHRAEKDGRDEVVSSAEKAAGTLSAVGERCDEEVVVLRAKTGRSPKQQQHVNRANRNGVVYSTHSSTVLRSIVQMDDRSGRNSGEGGATQRKKSRLQRRHTIAGHSHHRLLDTGTILGNSMRTVAERAHLVRAPSERKPRPSIHRATT